jgi:hypothetical protein
MGRRKAKQTPGTTPGFVGATPLEGSSRRRPDQRAAARNGPVGFDQADATRPLRPAGFFGNSMPRTALLEREVPEGGGAAQPVVEAPADASLAPVTIADIDKGGCAHGRGGPPPLWAGRCRAGCRVIAP